MTNHKLSRTLSAIEARTLFAERAAGRMLVPGGLHSDEGRRYLLGRALACLTPEERVAALDLASIIRSETADETGRARRQFRAGDCRPVADPGNMLKRHEYFRDYAAYAMAAMTHAEAAAFVQEAEEAPGV